MLKKKNIQLLSSIKLTIALMLLVSSCSSDDSSSVAIATEEQPEISENPEVPIEDRLINLSIQTGGAQIVDEPKINAKFTITTAGELVYTGDMGIEIRGSSSQLFPKKGYGFETRDAENNDLDVSLVEFPEEEDWILHGPYSDKSLVRNALIYDLSRDMGNYASRTEFVELAINDNYQGVYVFMEKLKRDSGRIDINKLKDDENTGEDLTGGYILKIDKSDNEGYTVQNSFNSSQTPLNSTAGQQIRFLYEYPDADDITTEQKNYISTYINDFETALGSDAFADVDDGYQAYIDVDSFIDFFILNELSKNVDGYRISTYMHKDKNEKLKMGPIWDFNIAFGNADYCEGGEPNGWAYQFNERCSDDFWQVPFWWDRLLQDPVYAERLKERWSMLRAGELSDAAIFGKIDSYTDTFDQAGAINANFDTWGVLGVYVWPNNFIGTSYDEEIAYLRQWISTRTLWLDDAIAAL